MLVCCPILAFMDFEMLRIEVPSTERVKISSINVRLETTVQQKGETFHVVIDVIKNSMCFKAFTITTEVSEIFMQQFWYTIKRVKDSKSYEFLLANKKCIVDAEVFRKILDICPRVESEEFTKVQDDDATLTFLIDLGYKGPLHKYTNMYVDHMHQPWRTLAAIINKCLSGKTTSNDRLRKSRIDILWGMFYRENIDYLELIWEEFVIEPNNLIVDVSKESEPKPAKKKTGSRSTRGVVIQEPPRSCRYYASSQRKQETSRRQPGTGGSSKGIGRIPEVPDESTVISATSHKGTGTKPGVPNEEKVISEAKVILEWGSKNESEHSDDSQLNFKDKEKKDKDGDADDEGDDHISDIQDTDDEDAEIESDEDEIYKYKICVSKDGDEEMLNAEVEDYGKGDAEIFDVAKADTEKIEEIKDDTKKVELPPTSSSLFVSSGFGDQFLKLSSDTSLSPSMPTIHVSVISKPSVLTPIPETPLVATVTSPPPSSVSTIPPLRVAKLEKDVSELKKIDHSGKALATLKSQVPMVVEHYLRSKISDDLQKVLQIHNADLIQKYSVKPALESRKIQKPIINLKQESEKSDSEIHKIKREQAEK
ncbi:hypothetical protein Tco_1283175 [Tanacetum coccineum]